MLKGLDELGYAVEWRVINAADYCFPQRRRRVFFIGYHKSTDIYKKIKKESLDHWVLFDGVMAKSFSISKNIISEFFFDLHGDIKKISDDFGKDSKISIFQNSGVLLDSKIYTAKTLPIYDGKKTTLKDIIIDNKKVTDEYFISDDDIDKWEYLKGGKKEIRKSASGFEYNYSEGGMIFPDSLNEPSRTIITGEGGSSPSRFKHVITTPKGLRRLVPVELERLNMFPDNHTELDGVSDTKRAFLMGNALVIGIVEKISEVFAKEIS
jgi:DNA (cytosine-5)-methyltransferase 1